jgi:hypothetical protein
VLRVKSFILSIVVDQQNLMLDPISGNTPEADLGSSSVSSGSSRVPQHYLPSQDQHQTTSHTQRFLLRGNDTQQSSRQTHKLQEPIFVSHGCLLIPVFFAAWWYYMKKCFRRVTGFIRNKPEPAEDAAEKFHEKFFRFEDAYIRWYVFIFGAANCRRYILGCD